MYTSPVSDYDVRRLLGLDNSSVNALSSATPDDSYLSMIGVHDPLSLTSMSTRERDIIELNYKIIRELATCNQEYRKLYASFQDMNGAVKKREAVPLSTERVSGVFTAHPNATAIPNDYFVCGQGADVVYRDSNNRELSMEEAKIWNGALSRWSLTKQVDLARSGCRLPSSMRPVDDFSPGTLSQPPQPESSQPSQAMFGTRVRRRRSTLRTNTKANPKRKRRVVAGRRRVTTKR